MRAARSLATRRGQLADSKVHVGSKNGRATKELHKLRLYMLAPGPIDDFGQLKRRNEHDDVLVADFLKHQLHLVNRVAVLAREVANPCVAVPTNDRFTRATTHRDLFG